MQWLATFWSGWHPFGQEVSAIIGNLLDGINTTDEARQFCSVNAPEEYHNLFRMYLTGSENCISLEC